MEHDMIVNEWVSYNTESWKWNSRFILGNRSYWRRKRMNELEVQSKWVWNKSDLCLLYNNFNKTDTSTFHLCLRLSFETSFLITHILIQCENCGNEIDRCFVTCLFRSLYSSHFCPFILRVTDEVSRTTKYSSFTEIN